MPCQGHPSSNCCCTPGDPCDYHAATCTVCVTKVVLYKSADVSVLRDTLQIDVDTDGQLKVMWKWTHDSFWEKFSPSEFRVFVGNYLIECESAGTDVKPHHKEIRELFVRALVSLEKALEYMKKVSEG